MKQQKGYVFRRYGWWFVRYSDSIMQPDGSIRRKQVAVKLAPKSDEFRDKNSVKALAAKILQPINAGDVDPQSTMRISDFIECVYLPQVKENLRRSTYKNYNDIARLHVLPRLGAMTLRKFRCCDAEKLLADVAKQAKTPHGLSLSHSTLKRIKTFLSAAFKTAKRLGAFDGENPVRDSHTPKGMPAKKTYAYSEAEIRAILSVLDEPARTVVLLAAHSGLRKGEIEGLLWRDFDGRSLDVQRSLWNGFAQAPKTQSSAAPIPVTRQLRMALEDHRKRLGDWARDGFPIFQSEVHTPLSLANLVKRVIVPRLERCTVCSKQKSEHTPDEHPFQRSQALPRWMGWHSFRRGLATNLHANGTDDKTIQSVLRHSNVRVTQDAYIKTIPESTINAMKAIGEKMDSTGLHAPFVHRPETGAVN
jgi:integrase